MTLSVGSASASAIVVAVPAAEALVGQHRARLDPAASWGVPAHVTVLFPFVTPRLIDQAVVARVASVAGALPVVDAVFGKVAWFDDSVVFVRPDPDDWFRAATARMHKEFPECPPYGGAFTDVVPHLTIGDRGPIEAMRQAADEVQPRLPITQRVDRLLLMCGSEAPGSWHTLGEFALNSVA